VSETGLSWLPAVPEDWGARLRALTASATPADDWRALVSLAQVRLGLSETTRLDRKITAVMGNAPPEGIGTRPVRLALLSSCTVDHLVPALRVGALRRGLWLDVYVADFGQYAQELDNPASALHAFRPDVVLFSFDAHHLTAGLMPGMENAEAVIAERLEHVRRQWARARGTVNATVIQQTILPTLPGLVGNNEYRMAGSRAAAVDRLNAGFRAVATADGVDLLAVDSCCARDGIAAWHDQMLWHRAKQDIHPLAAPIYGDLVGRLLAARQGRSFKCLVLDLDNTCWGGVIGDDGLAGIKLGQGSAAGEAFVAFQSYALALSKRGVILAVCSKNDEATALEAFETHPDMVLRRDDIACFVANWTDKATNLRTIARKLNIGLDALVFADDNPFERNIVRQELPMVAVPELPDEPGLYAQTIADAGYFEAVALTDDDLARAAQYQSNLKRQELAESVTDMDAYLSGLKMRMLWSPFNPVGLQRIVQLINKTNQFNLTTQRTDELAVTALMDDPDALTLQIRLTDKFGDNGIIGIVVGRRDAHNALEITTWLMSCRVLGRGVEQATFNLLARLATARGLTGLVGLYRPTAKNEMVRGHYERLGFSLTQQRDDGGTVWFRPLPAEPFATHIETVEV
jgi:FkbH-like protein